MNSQVYELIEDVCWAQLEADPDFKKELARRNKIVKKFKGKVPFEEVLVLDDAMFEGGRQMAKVMFALVMQIMSSPTGIFDMPETDGAGHLAE